MKRCPACNQDRPDADARCTECGGPLEEAPAPDLAAGLREAGVNVGSRNVITGEVIGHKEDIRVAGNATIVRHEDHTRDIKTCGFCGKPRLLLEGVICRRCGSFVCEEHYDAESRQCVTCRQGRSSEAEQRYMALLEKVMAGGRMDLEGRQQLDNERKRLAITDDRARELENNYKSLLSSEIDTLGRRERRRLETIRDTLLVRFRVHEALAMLAPLYERFRDNRDVRTYYLLALLEERPDEALRIIRDMRFDDLDKSLIHVEILARRGEFDRANYDVLKDAKRAFGEKDLVLAAREAELNLDEYRATGKAFLLDDARDCLEAIPPDTQDPYLLYARAYFRQVTGEADALDKVLALMRQKGIPPFYVLRKQRVLARSAPAPAEAPAAAPGAAAREDPVGAEARAELEALEDPRLDLTEDLLRDGLAGLAGRLRVWEEAAARGVPEAMLLAGLFCLYGVGRERDPVRAIEWIRRAAEAGAPAAQHRLGWMYAHGRGVAEDPALAVAWYAKAADQGHVHAALALARCRYDGVGAPRDLAEAFRWFQKAAGADNIEALYGLGLMHERGEGVRADPVAALKFYRQAADAGHAGAWYRLGELFFLGEGVARDLEQAVICYQEAATAGHVEAQVTVALLFERGEGLPKDPAEAAAWYAKAAEQGHAGAQYGLARLLDAGLGLPQDCPGALALLERAARQNHGPAMRHLGYMLENGRGAEPNPARARDWYARAVAAGQADAAADLRRLDDAAPAPARFCGNCGAKLGPAERFCGDCAAPAPE